MEKPVTLGLKNVYYAPITYSAGGSIVYGTPKRLPGGVNINLTPEGEVVKFYADDGLYYTSVDNMGYSGPAEFAEVTEDFCKEILGETVDPTNGILVENANVRPAHFALLFEVTRDQKNRRAVFYDCIATRPAAGSQTKTNSSNPQTRTLNLTCAPRPDGIVKATTADATQSSVYDAWYDAVVVPGVPVVTT